MIWLPRIGLALLALLGAVVVGVVVWWGQVSPVVEGRLDVAGVTGEIDDLTRETPT